MALTIRPKMTARVQRANVSIKRPPNSSSQIEFVRLNLNLHITHRMFFNGTGGLVLHKRSVLAFADLVSHGATAKLLDVLRGTFLMGLKEARAEWRRRHPIISAEQTPKEFDDAGPCSALG